MRFHGAQGEVQHGRDLVVLFALEVEEGDHHPVLFGKCLDGSPQASGVFGGFGQLLVFGFDYSDNPGAWHNSLRLLAEEVERTLTPVARPLSTAVANGSGLPSALKNISGVASAGAVSRPL